MIKRSINIFLILLLIVALSSSVFSARDFYDASNDPSASGPITSIFSNFDDVIDKLFSSIEPLAALLLGLPEDTSLGLTETVITRLIIFLIIFSLVFVTTNNIDLLKQNGAVRIIVTVGVSILATRWLAYPGGFIEAVMLPYSALGIAMTSILPFILFFFFVELGIRKEIGRKIAWIFFIIMFIFLWVSRYDELSSGGGGETFAMWAYPAIIVASLGCLWFDPTIQRMISRSYISRIKAGASKKLVRDLKVEVNKLDQIIASKESTGNGDASEEKRDRESLLKKIVEYEAESKS